LLRLSAESDQMAQRRLQFVVMAILQSVAALLLLWGYLPFLDLKGAPRLIQMEDHLAVLSLAFLLGSSCVIPVLLLGRLSRSWGQFSAQVLTISICALQLCYLIVDRQLFRVMRLHLDWSIVEVLRQPRALEGIGLSNSVVGQFAGVGVVSIACALGFWLAAAAIVRAFPLPAHWAKYLGGLALAVVALERLSYSVLSPGLMTDRDDPAEVLPLNAWMSFRLPEDTVFAVFGLKDSYRRHAEARAGSSPAPTDVRYPSREAHNFAPVRQERPNILLIGIESLRADAIDPEVMPNLFSLAERHTWAKAHFSGANCTHLGLFTLLYGLSPRIWGPMIDLSQPPFVYELARRAGYEVTATSSATPDWFGIDRQALRPELALGRYQGTKDPDGQAVADLLRYIQAPRGWPFFSFLFLNGTHFPYYVPPGADIFQPQVESIDINDANLVTHRDRIVNRYRNSLHRVDVLVGKILEAVGKQDANTVVAVTGDHGESFWDDGRFFHTSLLSVAQLHVPLILSIPGRGPERIERVSSHVDVIPTLMDAAGIELDPSTYSDGHSLITGATDQALAAQFSLGYPQEFALIRPQWLVRFRLENGRVRMLGAESRNGQALSGEQIKRAEEEAFPSLMKVLRYTSRWWPTSSNSS